MYIARTIEKKVRELSRQFKVVVVTGARQVGKSTMLKHCDPERSYVSLGKPNIRALAITEPELFLQRYEAPVIIDEIQYAPNLLDYIKEIVDQSDIKGQYWLTGSQPFHLMKNISETLSGRAAILNMMGLSLCEKLGIPDEPFALTDEFLSKKRKQRVTLKLPEIFEMIYKGSYPELYAGDITDLDVYYSSYLQTYLERDIRGLSSIADESIFIKFIRIVAARTGQPVKYSQLAAETGISQPTAQKWLSLLITSGLVYLLEPYYSNLTKRMTKMPKLYFCDTGLCAYLCGWSSSTVLEQGAMNGAFFETMVVTEVMKSFINNGKKAPLFYYRDTEQKEIDLIIEENQNLHPVEIKLTASPNKSMTKSFKYLPEDKASNGALICMVTEDYPLSDNVAALPVTYL